ncbi:hypothetical protein [Fibrella aestuarina]|uniref:hypothetical protein n=1 Tax=Fibrella aestuarina TaxID=651143 RepID=UPI0002E451A4|nr:hypothetical protein [Fibrella aestuarina]
MDELTKHIAETEGYTAALVHLNTKASTVAEYDALADHLTQHGQLGPNGISYYADLIQFHKQNHAK